MKKEIINKKYSKAPIIKIDLNNIEEIKNFENKELGNGSILFKNENSYCLAVYDTSNEDGDIGFRVLIDTMKNKDTKELGMAIIYEGIWEYENNEMILSAYRSVSKEKDRIFAYFYGWIQKMLREEICTEIYYCPYDMLANLLLYNSTEKGLYYYNGYMYLDKNNFSCIGSAGLEIIKDLPDWTYIPCEIKRLFKEKNYPFDKKYYLDFCKKEKIAY